MMRASSVLLFSVLLLAQRTAAAEDLSMAQAVSIALQRNHDVIAAKLDIDAARFDKVQASLYPNPLFGYSVGDLVVGRANPQGPPPIRSPGFFGQTVHTASISEVVDVWGKRNARMRAAERSVQWKTLLVQDALREIVYAVRSAFAEVVREQSERALSHEMRARYEDTLRLSRSRFAAGDISEAELRKLELEGMRYQNEEVQASMELELAREKLAALLALDSEAALPAALVDPVQPRTSYPLAPLTERALKERPDVLAARAAKLLSDAEVTSAQREAYPDISLGLMYTHSEFQVSGDNPNTLGVGVSLPIPLFDRNQANIGRAQLEVKRAQNDGLRLLMQVKHDVAEAEHRLARGQTLLDAFEGGGMLQRAEGSLHVAESSYKAGASSLLELLEAQRTYIETRAQYLRAGYDYQQAKIDMMHAVGGELP
ncbi:MAG TPA: TolC family protein [Polyangiales bacterium]